MLCRKKKNCVKMYISVDNRWSIIFNRVIYDVMYDVYKFNNIRKFDGSK